MVNKNFILIQKYYQNDNQISFSDLENYKLFGYENYEEFKEDIHFYISIYGKNIIKPTNYRIEQTDFREKLINKYTSCVITKNPVFICQACHIRPYSQSKNNDIDNGLLLSAELHITFDKYYWSINPSNNLVEILIDDIEKIGTIVNHKNKSVDLQLENKIYLLEHYSKFINLKNKINLM